MTKAIEIWKRTLRNILKRHENNNNTEEIVNQLNIETEEVQKENAISSYMLEQKAYFWMVLIEFLFPN